MRKMTAILILTLLAGAGAVQAQWAQNGPHIYNTNSGFIGMFVANPLNPLHVRVGANANLGFRRTWFGAAGIGAFNDAGSAATPLQLHAAAIVVQAGNVGILTSSPLNPLHVRVGTDSNVGFRATDVPEIASFNDAGSAPGRLRIDASKLVILTTGAPTAVGVGTDATEYGLTVADGMQVISTNVGGTAVYGQSDAAAAIGVAAIGGIVAVTQTGIAVHGSAPQGAYAGYFHGTFHQQDGTFSKAAGGFRIDHPLDPENRYLQHSFAESPDMMNVYDGVVVLDAAGQAVVELPKWFEALNKDLQYQLTCIGAHADVFIAGEVADNRFRIGGGKPGLKVSWQITGVRQDAYANAHRIAVEEEKAPQDRGSYLHPVEHGQAAERAIPLLREPRLQAKREKQRQPDGKE